MRYRNDLTADLVRSTLQYEETTGVFTRMSNGKVAGTKTPKGYVIIRINRRNYLAHRLAWLWVNGVHPKAQIDHQNGDKDDNRISNLREANDLQNRWNERKRKNNTSGHKNVCFHGGPGRTKPWRVVVRLGGKLTTAGYFRTKEEASEAAKTWRKTHHDEFANHG